MKRRGTPPVQFIRHDDWQVLIGGPVQIRRRGDVVQIGIVEHVMADSSILCLQSDGVQPRRAFNRGEGYEVWISPRDLQPRTATQAAVPA